MADVLGTFEQAVLLAIARLEDGAYGRAILNEVQTRLERDVAAGAVHATLVRLEEKGLLTSRRALDGGPSRRRFALSPVGARALAETRAMRDRLWDGVALQRLLSLAR